MLYPRPKHPPSLDLENLSLEVKMLRVGWCPKVKRVFLISSSRDEMTGLAIQVDLARPSVLSQTTVDR
jgi:hypothetical protein